MHLLTCFCGGWILRSASKLIQVKQSQQFQMFAGLGWKRQRRDEGAVECAGLASSPASIDAPHTPSGSTCGSDCGSEAGDLMRGGLRLVRAGSTSSSETGSDAGSLELTACSPSARAAACGPRAAELAGVRAKAAYFEALIRSNTTAYVQCGVASGLQHDLHGTADSGDGAAAAGEASALMCLDEEVEAAAGSDAPGRQCKQEDAAEDAFDEVTVVLRVPRGRQQQQQRQQQATGGGSATEPTHERYGTPTQMAQLIERLSSQLSVAEHERAAALAAVARRAAEVDNLQRVVRELTESRAKAVAARVTLAERHADLQVRARRGICRTTAPV